MISTKYHKLELFYPHQKYLTKCFIFNIRKFDRTLQKINELGWLRMENRKKLQNVIFFHYFIKSAYISV